MAERSSERRFCSRLARHFYYRYRAILKISSCVESGYPRQPAGCNLACRCLADRSAALIPRSTVLPPPRSTLLHTGARPESSR